MSDFTNLLAGGQRIEGHRPWPRIAVDATEWQEAANALALGEVTLLSLWGDAGCVHMALLREGGDAILEQAADERFGELIAALRRA